MALQDIRPDAMRCTRCSYCKWVPFDLVKSWRFSKGCPSVDYNNFHSYSGGGRLITALSLMDGRSQVNDKVVDIAFKCQLCGNCDVTCKVCRYDMWVLDSLHEFRFWLAEQDQVPAAYRPMIANLREKHNMGGKPQAARAKWAEGLGLKDIANSKAEVLFHAGCRYSYNPGLQHVARTAAQVLGKAGVDFAVSAEEHCCGGKAYDMGYKKDFESAAEGNLKAWAAAGVKTVVTPCATCYHTFKRLYPEVGSQVEVLHTVELVDRLIKEGKLKLTKPVAMKVTYHDPCHLGRQGEPYVPWKGEEKKIYGQAVVYDPPRPRYIGAHGIYDAPRDVLAAIPGLELVEMDRNREAAWCCGAGGGVREAYPEFSAWTAGERIEEAKVTGADAIVTACPGCEQNFIDAVAADGTKMKVFDVVELVAQAL